MRVSKYHKKIAAKGEGLGTVSYDQVRHLFHLDRNSLGGEFLQKLIHHGHEGCCIREAARMLRMHRVDIPSVKRVLTEAARFNQEGAIFFLMFLKALGDHEAEVEEAFLTFKSFFRRRRLMAARRIILSHNSQDLGLRSVWVRRDFPRGLSNKIFCTSKTSCKGNGRRPGIHWPPPGSGDEYDMQALCLHCCFDVKIQWFLVDFGFVEDEFLF